MSAATQQLLAQVAHVHAIQLRLEAARRGEEWDEATPASQVGTDSGGSAMDATS